MVDYVRLGPASPVPATRPLVAGDVVRIAQPAVAPAAPQALSLAAALAQKGPPYDAGKVAQLRAAIASGAYAIDVGTVADAMMRFSGGGRV
jgi:flagellar biosynthesis anti-sigma factor FlgM